jgi:hypothetical protein
MDAETVNKSDVCFEKHYHTSLTLVVAIAISRKQREKWRCYKVLHLPLLLPGFHKRMCACMDVQVCVCVCVSVRACMRRNCS